MNNSVEKRPQQHLEQLGASRMPFLEYTTAIQLLQLGSVFMVGFLGSNEEPRSCTFICHFPEHANTLLTYDEGSPSESISGKLINFMALASSTNWSAFEDCSMSSGQGIYTIGLDQVIAEDNIVKSQNRLYALYSIPYILYMHRQS